MKTQRSGLRLTPQERIVVTFFVAASALIWAVLALSWVDAYVSPSMANAPETPTAWHVPSSRSGSTPSLAVYPSFTPSPTFTPTPQPTLSSTVEPSPTATITPTPTAAQGGVPAVPLPEDTLVIAMLGVDDARTAGIWRTDTIILVFIDRKAQKLAMLSIPRDLWVSIPGYGHSRINTVDALGERTGYSGGGPALLDRVLLRNLGVSIDHYVRVDFQGFVRLIDAVGGVTVNVERPIRDSFPDPHTPSGYATITLPAGPRHMTGHMALTYCRSRITTDDFDRTARQQQVLLALWEQALTLETLAQAPQLWQEFNGAFDTDLGMIEAVQLAYHVHGIGPENARTQSLDFSMARPWTTSQGAEVLLPNTEAIRQLILNLFYPPE